MLGPSPTVILDACVLYPATVRNLLIQLATAGLFHARWTETIHEEWMRSLLTRRTDLNIGQLERIRQLMDRAVPDCLVIGHEPLIDTLMLPDPNDRHVLPAAIHSEASVIVTVNLKDFPAPALSPLGLTAQHPDSFVVQLIDSDPGAVCAAAKAVRARLSRPAYDPPEFLDLLQFRGLPSTASRLREFMLLL